MPSVADPGLQPLAETESTRTVELHQVVSDLKTGQHIGAVKWDIGCMQSTNVTWTDRLADDLQSSYEDSFIQEMQRANIKWDKTRGESIETEAAGGKSRIKVAGRISDIKLNSCAGLYRIRWDIDTYFKMTWQLYDTDLKEVVHEVVTEGRHKKDNVASGEMDKAVLRAYEMSIRNLIADPEFRRIIQDES